ncbi:hypothetical protein [Candidatus Ichthyocystis hellenicum]|uniref:hypothetical protein n=1 Tax=Candidatus Ichthyocystis hellenicum TaxID=1561003 RepID=UPI000B89D480|nr:hypothetical protein [Candidatus Ichthyocystis hellenicum]
MKSIFGVDCKKSIKKIESLIQLSPREYIEFAILVNNKKVITHRTKYETILDRHYSTKNIKFSENCDKLSIYNDYSLYSPLCNSAEFEKLSKWKKYVDVIINMYDTQCLVSRNVHKKNSHWKMHPMYQVIYDKNNRDIIKNYYDKRDEILSLPELPASYEEREKILYYYDPLQFIDIRGFSNAKCSTDLLSYELMVRASRNVHELDKSMHILEKSNHLIRKNLYNSIMSLCLHAKSMASSLETSARNKRTNRDHPVNIEKEYSIIKSLNILVCFRDFMESLFYIKEIINIMEFCNFVPLEDIIKVFEYIILINNTTADKDNKSEYEREIASIHAFLREKYPSIITRRKFKIDTLLKKINLSNDEIEYLITKIDKDYPMPIFVRSVIESVKKIKSEIKEMEVFMKKSGKN